MRGRRKAFLSAAGCLLTLACRAQGLSASAPGMEGILEGVYESLLPLCQQLMEPARALAGLGALLYIAHRVWGHLARAEPIDVFALLRPFALGLAILLYPSLIGVFNGILQPLSTATASVLQQSQAGVDSLLALQQRALQETSGYQLYASGTGAGDESLWYQYSHPQDSLSDQAWYDQVSSDLGFAAARYQYDLQSRSQQVLSTVLEFLFEAASLCLETLRCFQLLLLALIGPIVLALSVFEVFRPSLQAWVSRYVQVYLWLPLAQLLGSLLAALQEGMLRADLAELQARGSSFFSATDTAYLIFLLIGVLGYGSIPATARWMLQAGGSQAPGALNPTLIQALRPAEAMPAAETAPAASGGAAASEYLQERLQG